MEPEDTGAEKVAKKAAQPIIEDRDFTDVLKSFIGKLVTMVNSESYEDVPLGHQIRGGWYPAKPVGLGNDYLIVVTEKGPTITIEFKSAEGLHL